MNDSPLRYGLGAILRGVLKAPQSLGGQMKNLTVQCQAQVHNGQIVLTPTGIIDTQTQQPWSGSVDGALIINDKDNTLGKSFGSEQGSLGLNMGGFKPYTGGQGQQPQKEVSGR